MVTQGELDALWDITDPTASEVRLRTAARDQPSPRERNELLTQVARALGAQRRYAEAHAMLDAIARDDEIVDARAALERGRLLSAVGNPASALPLYLHAAESGARLQHVALEVEALYLASSVDPSATEQWTAHALRVLSECDDPQALRWRARLLTMLGWSRFDRGEHASAYSCFRSAKQAADKWGTAAERIAASQALDELRGLMRVSQHILDTEITAPLRPDPVSLEHVDVDVPQGRFAMGDSFGEGIAEDGETPVHEIHLAEFRMDIAPVTNAQFARFVARSGYRTDAERFGWSTVHTPQVQADEVDLLGSTALDPEWIAVRGADWAHPFGKRSSWQQLPDHPVVHVSYQDALAYCVHSGRRLPTEAEWEYAARGGLHGKRYPWGDAMPMQPEAPTANVLMDTDDAREAASTSPVGAFPPNAYGLYDMVGNVFEWCADWFSPETYENSVMKDPRGPIQGSLRVLRGGSYLSSQAPGSYARVASRLGLTPDSSAGNCGFRTVGSAR